jgi:ATP-dependent DNA ligase
LLADEKMAMPHDHRVYGLKEGKLAKALLKALDIEHLRDGALLASWNTTGNGNFPLCLERVFHERSQRGDAARGGRSEVFASLSLLEVNQLLDELCEYYLQTSRLAVVPSSSYRDQLVVLRLLFQNLSPLEMKWMARIIFRNLELPFDTYCLCSGIDLDMSRLAKNSGTVADLCQRTMQLLRARHNTDASSGSIWSALQLSHARLGVFLPPALCERVNNLSKVSEKFLGDASTARVIVDTKYDGERLQVHYRGNQSRQPLQLQQGVTAAAPALPRLTHEDRVTFFSRYSKDSTVDRALLIPDLLCALAPRTACDNVDQPGVEAGGAACRAQSHANCISAHDKASEEARFADLLALLRGSGVHVPWRGVVEDCILDGELLAYDEESQSIAPFGSVRDYASRVGDAQTIRGPSYSANFFSRPMFRARPQVKRTAAPAPHQQHNKASRALSAAASSSVAAHQRNHHTSALPEAHDERFYKERQRQERSSFIWVSRDSADAASAAPSVEARQRVHAVQRSEALAKYQQHQSGEGRHLIAFFFDCLLLNGVSLLRVPLFQRKLILAHIITRRANRIEVAPSRTIDFSRADQGLGNRQLQDAFVQSFLNHDEGLIIKSYDGQYRPNLRRSGWMKIKVCWKGRGHGLFDDKLSTCSV